MGKGSGKLITWFTELPSGIYIFEFQNLRTGRASFFASQIKYRLPSKSIFRKLLLKPVSLPLKLSKHITYFIFW